MKAMTVKLPATLESLSLEDRPEPAIEAGKVKVRWHASSLNFHDYVSATGALPIADGRILLSDGAGEVVEVGDGVKQWKTGDRVMSLFFPGWQQGAPQAGCWRLLTGETIDGCAAEFGVLAPESLTAIPAGWTYAQAATLPCAALTGWRALVEDCRIKLGDRVLVEGSGGLAIFCLQFARMAGATVYATSSSADKAQRLRDLGAVEVINYRDDPQWGETINRLSGGGVDHVIDSGGGATIAQSTAAARVGGNVVLVGVLGGLMAELHLGRLFRKQLTLHAVAVGSRAMQLDMVKAIDASGIKPVIDSHFPLERLADAFRHQIAGKHFGKIVIDIVPPA